MNERLGAATQTAAPDDRGTLRRARGRRGVRGLQAIVSYRTRRSQPDVCDRRPAFQFVMTVAMEQIRRSDGNSRCRRFNRRERRVIVDDIVRQKNFLPSSAPHIQSRKIIKRARRSDSREQPVVFLVPKPVLSLRQIIPLLI